VADNIPNAERDDDLDYRWLDPKLEAELNLIVESLESGATVTATDFARLVEHHRETIGDIPGAPPRVEWNDNFQPDAP
jgi:hypothetical protein